MLFLQVAAVVSIFATLPCAFALPQGATDSKAVTSSLDGFPDTVEKIPTSFDVSGDLTVGLEAHKPGKRMQCVVPVRDSIQFCLTASLFSFVKRKPDSTVGEGGSSGQAVDLSGRSVSSRDGIDGRDDGWHPSTHNFGPGTESWSGGGIGPEIDT